MTKLVFKTKPRPYQVPALKKMVKNGGGGLWVPMRYGKSWIAINWASAMSVRANRVMRCLVICPLDVIGVWEDEFSKHCPISYINLSGPDEFFPQLAAPNGLEVHIINYERAYAREPDNPERDPETGKRVDLGWSAVTNQALMKWKPDIVILDEAHHIGNPTVLRSKKIVQLGSIARHRLFLSGTPWHRKPFFVFGQFKFYDQSILGSNFGAFKKQIAIFGGFGNYEVKRYHNLKWLRDKVRPHVFVAKKVPSAPPVVRSIRFSLEESRKAYVQMEKESILQVGGEEFTAPIVLTRHLRCSQIAGGWLKSEDGKYVRVGSEKRRALERRLTEFKEQEITKLVVGCRFIPELRDVVGAGRACGYRVIVVHGGVNRKERQRRRELFQEHDNVIFAAQFEAAKEGIDLSSADTMVFYGLPESYLTYAQFKDRILKYGEKRTLLYEHLLAKNTRDMVTYEALQFKKDVADYIMENPKLVERLSSRK